jgi:hypothetical protein
MAYLGNYGGTFAGDVGSLTRLATSAPFAEYLQEQIFLQSRMIRAGIMAREETLVATVGTRVEAPFFDPINPTEEVMTSGNDWGTSGEGHFTIQKITSSTQYATITHRGFAYGVDKLSKLAIGEDPMAAIAAQFAPAIDKLRVQKLVSHLEGLLGTNGPLNATHNVNKSVTTGATEDNYLTVANVIEARYKLNERQSAITTIVMHSLEAAYLEQIGMLTWVPSAALAPGAGVEFGQGGVNVRNTSIGYFAGLQVIVDDQCPIIGTAGQQRQFVSYLCGPGVVREGDQAPIEIEPFRNPLSKQDGLVIDYHHIQHVPGTSWNTASDNPTNAALATGTNWALAYAEPRLIPAVRLVTNSPFGGTI